MSVCTLPPSGLDQYPPGPCSLRWSSLQQPLVQPWPGFFPCFTGASPTACHVLPHMKALLSAFCSFWIGHSERVQFCTSYCSSCKNTQSLQGDHCPTWLHSHRATNSCDLHRATRREKGRGRAEEGEHSRPELQLRPELASKPSPSPPTKEGRLNSKLLGVAASSSIYP